MGGCSRCNTRKVITGHGDYLEKFNFAAKAQSYRLNIRQNLLGRLGTV